MQPSFHNGKLITTWTCTKQIHTKNESGTEVGHSLEFDFIVPPQPLRLARQSKDN